MKISSFQQIEVHCVWIIIAKSTAIAKAKKKKIILLCKQNPVSLDFIEYKELIAGS